MMSGGKQTTVSALGDPAVLGELRHALAASGTGTWRWESDTGIVRWDATLEALSGLEPGTFGSTFEAWIDTLHQDEVDGILTAVEAAIAARSAYHFEHRVTWPDGSVRWLECRGQVTTDDDGGFTGTVGCAVDITDRHRGEVELAGLLERERALRSRFEFLVELTDTALTTTDHSVFMNAAAHAAVPRLGDWCSVHFIPEPGAELEVVVAHSDPSKIEWAEQLARRFPYEPDGRHGVPAVIRSGVTEFIERMDDGVIEDVVAAAGGDAAEVREILGQLAVTSAITVPLTTKRGVLGAMQFVSAESGHGYDRDDVALAEVVASRVADALDNMWLTAQHRQIATTLQRALLPPVLPPVPGVDVAVRYWPAGAAVDAGGDFYDIFRTGPATWSLLIGDVCGSGSDAAAVTSVARHTVRAAARHSLGHEAVLDWLNEAIGLSNRDKFCTAAYGTLEARDGAWWLALAVGGHPLPVVASASGEADLMGRHGTLLGVFEKVAVHVEERRLDVGDVVVLYTDGITDLPPPHSRTEADVVDLVAPLAGRGSASAIADALHHSATSPMSADERPDDIALVVLRITDPPPR
jgi:PAS domain S-box-containing protein